MQVKHSSHYCSRLKRNPTKKKVILPKSGIYQKRHTNKILLYFLTLKNYLISFARQLLNHYNCRSPQYYRLHRHNYHVPEFLPQIRSKHLCTDEQNLDKHLLSNSQYLELLCKEQAARRLPNLSAWKWWVSVKIHFFFIYI